MEFRILGPVGVTDGAEDVVIGGSRQRRLLGALLVDDGRVVSVDRLVDVVWGDEAQPPDAAGKTVLSYVSRLRSAVGDGHIVTEAEGYRLVRSGVGLDAERFAALVADARTVPPGRALGLLDEGLGLWRGRAFGELADEQWARPSAVRLEELRLVAFEEKAQARLDLGAHAEAVAELQALVDAHPLRERFRLQLMLALHRSGRQAEALRAYQDYRRYLADETGLEPSRDLVELERRIALADPSLTFVTAGRTTRGYVLADVIGEGAFGTVYRAVQPSVGREVAVKVVKAELADDPAYIRRFEAEARVVARLEHPHVVPLYDFWREPGGAYLVFRYLRGGTGASRPGPWPLTQIDRLVGEVGSALAAAHDAGIVHRDVKPANILFDDGDSAYLADFGIALDTPTQNSVVSLRSAGSPLYASPEQVRDGIADARSDQYGFGIVVWELLAGVPPFDDDRVTTLLRTKLEHCVPSIASRRPDVPAAIDALLQRATAVQPQDRYPSMSDLLLAWSEAITRPALATITTGDLPTIVPPVATSATLARLHLAVNPYKGLRAFDEADTSDFFGRDADIDSLTALVAEHRFVAVVGPSGSGKSSLVRAGLVPRLRSAGSLVAVAIPGQRPLDELAEAFLQVAVHTPRQLRDHLADAETFTAVLDDMLPRDGSELIVVIDQFEEFWTLSNPDERERLLNTLAHAVTMEGRLRVIATLRADFYDRPLTHPAIGPLVSDATFAVTPLGPVELEQAITAPAARVGVRLEAGLVADLVADCASHPAALPLLQYTLTELFDQRSGATMTVASYEEMGGLAGAIASRAEAVYAGLDEPDQAAARRVFTRLVTPGEGGEDTRRRTRRTELAAVPDTVIDAFGTARLLTFDVDPGDRAPTIEVAHEALIRQWPRLRGWLNDDRDGLRIHRHLTETATAWHTRGQEVGDLYRGARLATATDWATQHADDLNPTEGAFLQTSQRRARRTRRLARSAVSALAALVVIAIITAVVAINQQHRANQNAIQAQNNARQAAASAKDATDAATASDLRRLAFEAQAVATEQPQLALLLAEEAYRRNPGVESESALLTSLDSLRHVSRYFRLSDQPLLRTAAVSQDGRVVVVRTATHVIVVDGETFKPTGVTMAADLRSTVRLSVDGQEVATGTDAGVVRRFSTTTGQEVAPVLTVAPGVSFFEDNLSQFGVPFAYLTGGRLAVADGSTLLVVAPGTTSVEQRQPTASTIVTIEASASGRYLFLGQQGLTANSYVFDDAIGKLRETPGSYEDAGFDEAGHRMFATNQKQSPEPLDELDLTTWQIVKTNQSQAVQPINWTVLPDGSSFIADANGSIVHHFNANFEELAPLADPRLGQTLALSRGRVGVVVGDGIGILDLTVRGGLAAAFQINGQDQTGPLATSANGKRMAVYAPDGIRVYDVSTMKVAAGPYPLPTYYFCDATSCASGPEVWPPWMALSADGRILLYTSLSAPVTVVDTSTGSLRVEASTPLPPTNAETNGVAVWPAASVSPDGRYVAFATAHDFRVVDLTTNQLKTKIPFPLSAFSGGPFSVWDPSGTRVLFLPFEADGIVLDATSGEHVSIGRFALAGAWSPDGSQIAVAATQSDPLTLHDSRTGQTVKRFLGPSPGLGLEYTPDGKGLLQVSEGDPLALELFTLDTGSIVGRPVKLDVTVNDGPKELASTPDLKTFYVSTALKPTVAYDLDPQSWARKACEDAGRNLTQDEWKTYLGSLGPYRPTCSQYPAGA